QRSEVASVAFDTGGRMVASGSTNGVVNIWDTTNGELLHSIPGEGGTVASVAFHPTERILASGADDGGVNLWDTTEGKLLRTCRGLCRQQQVTPQPIPGPSRRRVATGLAGGGNRSRTFRPFRDQCLSELAKPCAETTRRPPTDQ